MTKYFAFGIRNISKATKISVLATAMLASQYFQGPSDSLAGGATLCVDEVIVGGTLGNVSVPAGASCSLMNLTVDGNLKAEGAADIAMSEVTVNGNISIAGSTGIVDINGAVIDGNIAVTGAMTTFIQIANAQVTGNVTAADNSVEGSLFAGQGVIFVRPNDIDGNLTVVGNVLGAGALVGSCTSGGNTVAGNVTMSDNEANFQTAVNCSTVGGNITVAGNQINGGVLPFDADVQVTGNTVAGNVSVQDNTAPDQIAVGDALAEPGQPQIFVNLIEGNLSCAGNDPDPTTEATDPADFGPVEDGNVVGGKLDCFD